MTSQPSTLNPQPSLALIGAGYWGKNLARNFNALGALHTICDSQATTLKTYQDEYAGVKKTTDIQDVLDDAAITRAAVAAPAALHYALVRQMLLAGKDVFVEKPLCLDAQQGQELVELAVQSKCILMVGHLLQYHPCIQKLQALVAEGVLGKLYYVTCNRLNLGKIRREENALWSFAPHDISVILSLTGNQLPECISCAGESYLNQGVGDVTLTTLRFASRVRAHVYVSWLNPFKEQKLTVVGSNGLAVFDDTRPWAEKLILQRDYLTWTNGQMPTPSKSKGETVTVPESEPLKDECAHFLECCHTRRSPRTDGAEGLRVLQVLQMAQRSLENDGEPIRPSSVVSPPSSAPSPPPSVLRPPLSSAGPTSQPSTINSQLTYFVHPTAVVDAGAEIGKGSKIWHFCHVMKGAQIGERCILGQNVNVDGGAVIGNNVKVQNNVSIYTGVVIEDDVFLGPSCVLTNVSNPRSQVNRHALYEKTVVKRGATIGANATIVCGVTIGRYAFVAAGSVVTKDVADYALVMGNPARQKGWMSRHGHILKKPATNGIMVCPESGFRYQLISETTDHGPQTTDARLRCLDLDEKMPLPDNLAKGLRSYDTFKEPTTWAPRA